MQTEQLVDRRSWWRIADPAWGDPVDTGSAAHRGGRWNPPISYPTLYLNDDIVTSRMNMCLMSEQWPYEPEELRPEHAPVLVGVTLPRRQIVVDVHTPDGVRAVGLPMTYPLDDSGVVVGRGVCQAVGEAAHVAGHRGVYCRSATSPLGEGRELAWFPATSRSVARVVEVTAFATWYWGSR